MEEYDYTYDPFQLENMPTIQRFSLQERVMAIILVVIFMTIPLYEISSEAFKANYVYQPTTYICTTSYFAKNINTEVQYIQGTQKSRKH